MAENPLFDRLIQQLATTDDPTEKAAIIAEITFDQQSAEIALVARRCIILRWFDEAILAALLPEEATVGAAEVAAQLADLPFVEQLAWGALTYHDLTRTGLLARYAVEEPELIKEVAALAAPGYQNHPDQKLAGPEALFCLIIAGQAEEATQQLRRLIIDLRNHEDWQGLLALFTTCDQANALPFVTPLQRTAYHHHSGGVALRQLGKLEEAIAAYQQAIALDERYTHAWNGLGNVYRNLKRYDEAIAAYQQAITLDDKVSSRWNNLGNVYRDRKWHDKAIAAYQRAITLDEKFAYPWNGLGNVYRDLKRHDEAIAAYQQAITLDEKNAYSWSNLGNVYYDQKRYEEAIAAYQQAITLDEKFAWPWNGFGLVYHDQKRHDEAIAAYQRAVALDEKFAYPWNNLGNVYRDRKQYEEAIAAYQRAITLDEKFAYPWNNLGNVYRDCKQYDEAIAAYQQAITLDRKFAASCSNLGSVLYQLERWTEAIGALRSAVTIDSTRLVDWMRLAGAAFHNGDEDTWRMALAQAQPLVDYNKFYNAACFESVAGHVDRALELLAQAAAAGQLNPAWAREDPDLHWLRHDPRFWALVGGDSDNAVPGT